MTIDRRRFMGASAAGAVALIRVAHAAADQRQINMGVIGAGGYGMVDAKAALKVGGVQIVAAEQSGSLHPQVVVVKMLGAHPRAVGQMRSGGVAVNGIAPGSVDKTETIGLAQGGNVDSSGIVVDAIVSQGGGRAISHAGCSQGNVVIVDPASKGCVQVQTNAGRGDDIVGQVPVGRTGDAKGG